MVEPDRKPPSKPTIDPASKPTTPGNKLREDKTSATSEGEKSTQGSSGFFEGMKTTTGVVGLLVLLLAVGSRAVVPQLTAAATDGLVDAFETLFGHFSSWYTSGSGDVKLQFPPGELNRRNILVAADETRSKLIEYLGQGLWGALLVWMSQQGFGHKPGTKSTLRLSVSLMLLFGASFLFCSFPNAFYRLVEVDFGEYGAVRIPV